MVSVQVLWVVAGRTFQETQPCPMLVPRFLLPSNQDPSMASPVPACRRVSSCPRSGAQMGGSLSRVLSSLSLGLCWLLGCAQPLGC